MYDMYPEWGPAGPPPREPAATRTDGRAGLARPAGQRRPAPRRQLASPHDLDPTTADRPDRSSSPSSPATASVRRSPPRRSRSSRRPPPAGVKFEPTRYDLGAERYLATGEVLPDSVLDEIREHDAILLGAVGGKPGDPNLPPGILERGLLLRLRFELDHYVNLRPSRIYPGRRRRPLADPGEVDFVVVREGTEGPYTGNGGALRVGTPARDRHRGQSSTRRTAWSGSSATPSPGRSSGRARKLTLVHKTNVLVHAGARVVAARRRGRRRSSPTSRVDYLHVDAATIFLATDPARFDVIVTDNLFGDIITDLAAAVTGGIGLAASGNVNPDRTAPEHVRAGARLGARHRRPAEGRPDRGDPVGRAAARPPRPTPTPPRAVEDAVVADLAARDPGATRRTAEVGDAIAARVAG